MVAPIKQEVANVSSERATPSRCSLLNFMVYAQSSVTIFLQLSFQLAVKLNLLHHLHPQARHAVAHG